MNDRVFTGDTLLIKGTGRTDFQNGNPNDSYNSIFNILLKLPEETLVFPAHDYKGETVSTIGEERMSILDFKLNQLMNTLNINNLNLPDPKMMDIAVPGNLNLGLARETKENNGLISKDFLKKSKMKIVY